MRHIILQKLFGRVVKLSRNQKRYILIGLDFVTLLAAFAIVFAMRWDLLYFPKKPLEILIFLGAPFLTIVVFLIRRHYKSITRYFQARDSFKFYTSILIATATWQLLLVFVKVPVSRTIIVGYILLGGLMVTSMRHILAWILNKVLDQKSSNGRQAHKLDKLSRKPTLPVAIYGVGEEAQQLIKGLQETNRFYASYCVDNRPSYWNQTFCGIKVISPEVLTDKVAQGLIKHVFIADKFMSAKEKKVLVTSLSKYAPIIRTIPRILDMTEETIQISDLRKLRLEELLGRAPIDPDPTMLRGTIKDKNILITGAGGSIGSELCRQALKLEPNKLILLDISEAALYQIETELKEQLTKMAVNTDEISLAQKQPEVVSVLGSALDQFNIETILKNHRIDTIYHSAAYKHVPMVELNPRQGLLNNIFSTLCLAKAAAKFSVDHMVLVSSDKAVRPTNIMGASKRVSELILQAFADQKNHSTIFTMVRFGNVLNSSGSVIKTFQHQIARGGPVTITHKDMVRYFMSIAEAAQLVMQSASIAKGGDVFVLDMGKPMPILELAQSMIELMGHEVRDQDNPDGNIAIEYIGIRHGEKLYEELILNDKVEETDHPRISKTSEPKIPRGELEAALERMKELLDTNNIPAVQLLLKQLVEGYKTDIDQLIPEDRQNEIWNTPIGRIQ